MSVNKYQPHLYLIPEDDANRQIANGFVMHSKVHARQVQVVAPAGGWHRVLEVFRSEYLQLVQQNDRTHVVMVVDFDGHIDERLDGMNSQVPQAIRSRVFVVGARDTPEVLKKALNKGFEEIGRSLADDCDRNTVETWGHEHLRHNEPDRLRLVQVARPILFRDV